MDNYRCPFCERINRQDFQRTWGGEGVVTFEPLNPVVPGHRLFVPIDHVADARSHPTVTKRTFAAAAAYASWSDQDFNLITSAGLAATQTVWHLHVHYVPRHENDGLMLPWTGQVIRHAT